MTGIVPIALPAAPHFCRKVFLMSYDYGASNAAECRRSDELR